MNKKKTKNINTTIDNRPALNFTLTTDGLSSVISPESNESYTGWAFSVDGGPYTTFLNFDAYTYTSPSPGNSTISVKGVYIDGFAELLGDATSEESAEFTGTTYTFASNDGSDGTWNLQNALGLVLNYSQSVRDTALSTYGDYKHWDVSAVTEIRNLLQSGVDPIYVDSIGGLDFSNWDVSSAQSIDRCFGYLDSSTPIPVNVSGWNLTNVSSADYVFVSSNIEVEGLDSWSFGSGLTSINKFFQNAYYLTMYDGVLDLSSWDVSSFSDFSYFFSGCMDIEEIDASNWDTSLGVDFTGMFTECNSLSTITGIDEWSFSSDLTSDSFKFMFNGCTSLSSLNLSGWNTGGLLPSESESPTTLTGGQYFGGTPLGYNGSNTDKTAPFSSDIYNLPIWGADTQYIIEAGEEGDLEGMNQAASGLYAGQCFFISETRRGFYLAAGDAFDYLMGLSRSNSATNVEFEHGYLGPNHDFSEDHVFNCPSCSGNSNCYNTEQAFKFNEEVPAQVFRRYPAVEGTYYVYAGSCAITSVSEEVSTPQGASGRKFYFSRMMRHDNIDSFSGGTHSSAIYDYIVVIPNPKTIDIVVTSGSGYYMLEGDVVGQNATVHMNIGDTVNFDMSGVGSTHPFWIKTSDSLGSSDAVSEVTNNGAHSTGTVSWTPTSSGTYYYRCGNHAAMIGLIKVSGSRYGN